jgi:hypothetical protein
LKKLLEQYGLDRFVPDRSGRDNGLREITGGSKASHSWRGDKDSAPIELPDILSIESTALAALQQVGT